MAPHPAEVETWIFDLDNTLYPAASGVFPQISARMTRFIAERFRLDPVAARAVQKQYFATHGTTMRGLMVEDGVDPHEFLAYVHDVDLSDLPAAPALDAALADLPGRKLVFTNGSTPHAKRILAHLGIDRHFDSVFDIADAGWIPKPAPETFAAFLARDRIDPTKAAMVEDMARNLEPAFALGMLTIWVRTHEDWAREGAEADWIHHRVDDLVPWLAGAGSLPGSREAIPAPTLCRDRMRDKRG
jgi:putative hydrolase of the HAD superfamily